MGRKTWKGRRARSQYFHGVLIACKVLEQNRQLEQIRRDFDAEDGTADGTYVKIPVSLRAIIPKSVVVGPIILPFPCDVVRRYRAGRLTGRGETEEKGFMVKLKHNVMLYMKLVFIQKAG